MTPDPVPPPKPEGLQFDKVEGSGKAMVCSVCGAKIQDAYFHVNGRPACASCKEKVEAQFAAMKARGGSGSAMTLALIYGIGASVAGAAVYYAVIALTDYQIGIVAILIGFMVGWSIRKATRGMGGRRYQILAMALTYFAVGLAYTPLALKEFKNEGKGGVSSRGATSKVDTTLRNDSTEADDALTMDSTVLGDSATVAAPAPAVKAKKKSMNILVALALTLVFIVILPVLTVVSSMPGGILSAIIIGIGMRQAWRMTGAAELSVKGPFKIGTPPQPAAG